MKTYPALDVRTDSADLLLALVDDFAPAAAEERGDVVRVFFQSENDRQRARRALGGRHDVAAVDVSDEDWARRSQENLQPVTVGGLTVLPRPAHSATGDVAVVIRPSMGFGTGHHATTRLCLAALQDIDVRDRTVLDVGTGSGVLAIAAALLGAAHATGIDSDPDALQSARENLDLNPRARDSVTFVEADLATAALPTADILTANLTGALLTRSAAALGGAVRAGGVLILSGLLAHERDEVCRAYGMPIVWERHEDGWAGLAVKKS